MMVVVVNYGIAPAYLRLGAELVTAAIIPADGDVRRYGPYRHLPDGSGLPTILATLGADLIMTPFTRGA